MFHAEELRPDAISGGEPLEAVKQGRAGQICTLRKSPLPATRAVNYLEGLKTRSLETRSYSYRYTPR